MSGYEWVQYFVQKHRLKRKCSGLRDRWNLCFWAKECAKTYWLNLNRVILTNFEDLLIHNSHIKCLKSKKETIFTDTFCSNNSPLCVYLNEIAQPLPRTSVYLHVQTWHIKVEAHPNTRITNTSCSN